MLTSIKRLQSFVENNELTPVELYRYIRFYEPEAVSDMEKAKAFLLLKIHDGAKIHQMMAAVKVKEYLVKNRDHNGREEKKPYDVYREIFPKGTIEDKFFNEAFQLLGQPYLIP